MKKIFLIILICLLLVYVVKDTNAATPITIKLQDNVSENLDDTYTYAGAGGTNYGSQTLLYVGVVSNFAAYSYIKFNISSIPDNQEINNSKLYLYIDSNTYDPIDLDVLRAYRINSSSTYITNCTWNESIVTWNSPPTALSNYINNVSIGSTGNKWVSIDVTSWVNETYLNTSPCISMLLSTTYGGNDDYISIFSKEYGTNLSKRPYLNITYLSGLTEIYISNEISVSGDLDRKLDLNRDFVSSISISSDLDKKLTLKRGFDTLLTVASDSDELLTYIELMSNPISISKDITTSYVFNRKFINSITVNNNLDRWISLSLNFDNLISIITHALATKIYFTITENAPQQQVNGVLGLWTPFKERTVLENPTPYLFANGNVTIGVPNDTLHASMEVYNESGVLLSHDSSAITDTANWTIDIYGGATFWVDTYYNVTNVTYTEDEYNVTVGLITYSYQEINITNNITTISNVLCNFSITNATEYIQFELYRCNPGCSDITDRADVIWSDEDEDGTDDRVHWYISSLTGHEEYNIRKNYGTPILVTEDKDILNTPIRPAMNVEWRNTVSLYNPNSNGQNYTYRIYPPLGARNFELDGLQTYLNYPAYGTSNPYILINNTYLDAYETETHILNYITDAVVFDVHYDYPEEYTVDDNATIHLEITVKNQANDIVIDIEKSILISYGENMVICKGRFPSKSACERAISSQAVEWKDTDSIIEGDYVLKIESMDADESQIYSLFYDIPTIETIDTQIGVQGVKTELFELRRYTFKNRAPNKLNKVFHDITVPYARVYLVEDTEGIEYTYSGDNYSVSTHLGAFRQGETREVYVWLYPEGTVEDAEVDTAIFNFLSWGNKITALEGNWLTVFSIFTLEGVLYTGGLIGILLVVAVILFILLLIVKRKKWIALIRRKDGSFEQFNFSDISELEDFKKKYEL